MPDREKVVKCLEQFRADLKPFCGNHADWKRFDTALALLKEQEAVEPIEAKFETFGSTRKCSNCNKYLFPAGRYCPHCGRLVKWDD